MITLAFLNLIKDDEAFDVRSRDFAGLRLYGAEIGS